MICGYSNIYDLCNNKYSYEYANFVTNSKYAIPNTGNDGAVYRIDKITQEKILLQPNSTLKIHNCNSDDDNPELTAWECYLWYKSNNGVISNPLISEYKKQQIKLINTECNNFLNNGILVKINNFATNITLSQNGAYSNTAVDETINYSILLPALYDDVINFSNILSLATLMNANDSSDPLPPLIDYYNNAHFLNYTNLSNILSNYFNKLKIYKLILDNLITNINNATTVDNVQKQIFYTNLPIISNDKSTNASSSNNINIKFSTLSCEEVNNLCDPPCDPDSCEACVDGNCVSLCAGNEYCYNGICESDTCCEYNSTSCPEGFCWSLSVNCQECNYFTCPQPNDLSPQPAGLGETTYRPCPLN